MGVTASYNFGDDFHFLQYAKTRLMGFKLMDLLKYKPPDKTKSDCVSAAFSFQNEGTFYYMIDVRVCAHYLVLLFKASETLWTVLMTK